ncbi:hypothetical protein QA597_07380 [Marinilabiliaceae bacterium ANBcel2]|nr:hypothetical protein [Marinilabiliaceae bacterium ANBcel2]
MTVNSGVASWNGLGYTTAAGGGAWFTSNYFTGKKTESSSMDMTMVNQIRSEEIGYRNAYTE